MAESFLPSDDSDDDDLELYRAIEQGLGDQESEHALAMALAQGGIGGEGVSESQDNAPESRPAPVRPKVHRRMSTRVPSLTRNVSVDSGKPSMSQESLDELLEVLRTFPTPPVVVHDAQQTASNIIYNNKITDTAVKLVSGIGKFSKFLSSGKTSQTVPETTPSPLHPSYSNPSLGAERFL
mmetsp:Transcript_6573/g.10742  ORF Transcript_6573/g.10742 Transcript_6573/m.10742 type:complete len:181 (-) Transcript_6573:1221-1763(-)|eukprot:CAMPEP_0114471684 /NCGR_PEP_ID=MMETSP0104-20121206/11968_1 /TAXON_ID=37642 ORGANISM="Paraphysomonas imperforata, Strain PA2" /NCGR_SAMPLE_ID=MMETSP0104 /ASSEMBLY_ACC=CAM_ASM_000202 /LENGTH=180 /DNA_ID=CAMNT_0001645595 /DNA_START=144 /DNA_END=686 /DNA_ORIENTATION=+